MEDPVTIDSDSSDENSPVIKRVNPARRRRGLANRLKISNQSQNCSDNDVISDDAAIYSTRVQKCFENTKNSIPVISEVNNASESGDEIEEEIVHEGTRKSSRRCYKYLNTQNSISLSDDDNDVYHCSPPDSCNTSLRSPTPPRPPSPPKAASLVIPPKKPRMNRSVQKALKNLTETKHHLYMTDYVTRCANTEDDDVICIDNDDNNMTLRIKCSTVTHRFKVHPNEPFKKVLSEVASKEKVTENQVLLVHNDCTISSSDSPQSLGITSVDIIECHIKHGDWSDSMNLNDSIEISNKHIQIYVQTSNSRQKLEFTVDRTKPLEELLRKYCTKTNTETTKVKLNFDGENIYMGDTADDLELEDGYTLDAIYTT